MFYLNSNLCSSFSCSFCLGSHGSLKLNRQSHIFSMKNINKYSMNSEVQSYISTLSTFTPQGSVASSEFFKRNINKFSSNSSNLPKVCSIQFAIFSLSDNMSARHFVPSTFLTKYYFVKYLLKIFDSPECCCSE